MAATPIPFSTKDNATATLSSGINASVLSIPLTTGHGARFPQPYSSTTTSGGSSTALNCTSISATIGGAAQAGKLIWNKTDGSVAIIVTVNTNDLVTTRLLGGSDNTWQNGDTWSIDPFVVTFETVATSVYGVQSTTTREEALVTGRSTDTLTVATAGRGYGSDPANTFSASDSVYLHVTSPIVERLKDIISVMAQQQDTDRTTLATANTNIGTLQDGTYHYVVTTGSANAYVAATPALAAYTAGNLIAFKANFTNTGSATINLNGLGAKTIKKNDGATNLAANDVISGQIVLVRYDGTSMQMLSPVGTPASITYYSKVVHLGKGVSAAVAGTSEGNFNTHTYTVPANDLVDGVAYRFSGFMWNDGAPGSSTFRVKLGTTAITSAVLIPSSTQGEYIAGQIFGTAAAGASVAVNGEVTWGSGTNIYSPSPTAATIHTANVATNGTLLLQFSIEKTNSTNSYLMGVIIEKLSTTPFA